MSWTHDPMVTIKADSKQSCIDSTIINYYFRVEVTRNLAYISQNSLVTIVNWFIILSTGASIYGWTNFRIYLMQLLLLEFLTKSNR